MRAAPAGALAVAAAMGLLAGIAQGAARGAAQAAVLTVGGDGLPTLAAAAAAAQDGDTIRIAPGERYECAILPQRDLVIEGPGAVLTDVTCAGKAILVLQGSGATVRDITLARARSGEGNGAGIRLEAQGLTLERVRFVNNQVGLLAGQDGPGEIRVTDCAFEGGGTGGERPGFALSVGRVGRLSVKGSLFRGVRGGQVASGAAVTELTDNRIATGEAADAGPAVAAWGGRLLMTGNTLAAGPAPPPRDAVVHATADAVALRGNRLENLVGKPLTLLLDWSGAQPVLSGNLLAAGDAEVSSSGYLRHRAGGAAREAYAGARAMAGAMKRAVTGAWR